jgi:hypothetical protein
MLIAPATAASRSSARSRLWMLVKLLISVGLLYLLLTRIDLGDLWTRIRSASPAWLAASLVVYTVMIVLSVWRWQLLLGAQRVRLGFAILFSSYLVALFYNNFLPSNIGGDVFRVADTARPAGSKTRATTVILVDRVIGLLALGLVAALGSTLGLEMTTTHGLPAAWTTWLWAGFAAAVIATAPAILTPGLFMRLLRPLTIIHPEWVGDRLEQITEALTQFRARRDAVIVCFLTAFAVQAFFVVYYAAIAKALGVPVSFWDLAVIVPLSFLVQMMPVSINGFGVREAAFSFFFTRLGFPLASALAVSLVGTGVQMLFSLSGAAVHVARRSSPTAGDLPGTNRHLHEHPQEAPVS